MESKIPLDGMEARLRVDAKARLSLRMEARLHLDACSFFSYPFLQYQVGESCAYENASRTLRDTRNSMEVHLVRGARHQETAQRALGI